MTEANRLYARSVDVVETQVDGKVMLLHVNDWRYFALDTAGSAIWSMLESPKTIEDIVARLMNRFDVDAERCRADSLVFLQGLIADGAVVEHASVH